jgi:phage gpG-like protein
MVKWHDEKFKAQMRRKIEKNIERAAKLLERDIKISLRVDGPTSPGSAVGHQSGRLMRSITHQPFETLEGNPGQRVGTNVVYARIHEYGGRIKPKGKYLTVPVSDMAKKHSRNGGRARDFPVELKFIPSKPWPVLVGDDDDSSDEVHYVLMTEVEIPKRPYMRPALERNRAMINKTIGVA